ncbi:hypothetical protein KQ945_02710 [Bacillus subtilis subsp. subtilis]|nr:hypothetical protein [Bacillus subtilis subsp. subtilis]
MDGIAPPPLPAPRAAAGGSSGQDDAAQLRLLSVLHYVLAGFTVLFSLFPVLYLVLGIAVLSGAMPVDSSTASTPSEARLLGGVFIGLGAVFFVGMLGMAAFIGYAARCLARQQRHTLCLVAAALCCMFMPLGTILGVFTLVTLTRASVRARFAHGAPASPSSP